MGFLPLPTQGLQHSLGGDIQPVAPVLGEEGVSPLLPPRGGLLPWGLRVGLV